MSYHAQNEMFLISGKDDYKKIFTALVYEGDTQAFYDEIGEIFFKYNKPHIGYEDGNLRTWVYTQSNINGRYSGDYSKIIVSGFNERTAKDNAMNHIKNINAECDCCGKRWSLSEYEGLNVYDTRDIIDYYKNARYGDNKPKHYALVINENGETEEI